MSQTRWDPFEDSFRIIERFGGRFRGGWPFDEEGAGAGDAAFVPLADVFQSAEGLCVEVELPGVCASQLRVGLSGGLLTVEAERPFSRAGGQEVLSLEGRWGRMRREIVLPPLAQTKGAVAELRQGVLRVMIPLAQSTARTDRTLSLSSDPPAEPVPIE